MEEILVFFDQQLFSILVLLYMNPNESQLNLNWIELSLIEMKIQLGRYEHNVLFFDFLCDLILVPQKSTTINR